MLEDKIRKIISEHPEKIRTPNWQIPEPNVEIGNKRVCFRKSNDDVQITAVYKKHSYLYRTYKRTKKFFSNGNWLPLLRPEVLLSYVIVGSFFCGITISEPTKKYYWEKFFSYLTGYKTTIMDDGGIKLNGKRRVIDNTRESVSFIIEPGKWILRGDGELERYIPLNRNTIRERIYFDAGHVKFPERDAYARDGKRYEYIDRITGDYDPQGTGPRRDSIFGENLRKGRKGNLIIEDFGKEGIQ